jgi:hypothetical protein
MSSLISRRMVSARSCNKIRYRANKRLQVMRTEGG